MKKILGIMFVCVLLLAAGPAFAGIASQTWKCEMDDDVTEMQVIAMAEAWTKAAKSVEGGENIKTNLRFPVAVDAIGDYDVLFEVMWPSFSEWGKFWDNYSGSDAAKLEDSHESDGVVCPDSAVWEIDKIK